MRQPLLFSLLLVCALAASISPKWSTPAGGQQSNGKCSKIENNVLYLPGVSRGSFKAISTLTGSVVWDRKGSEAKGTMDHCYTVISTVDSILHLYYNTDSYNSTKVVAAYRKSDGVQLWRRNLAFNSVSWTAEHLLLISHHRSVGPHTTIRSVRLADGKPVGQFALPSQVTRDAQDSQVNSRYFPDTNLLLVFVDRMDRSEVSHLWALKYATQNTTVLWNTSLPNLDHSSPDACVFDNSATYLRLNSTLKNYVAYAINNISERYYALSPAQLNTTWNVEAPVLLTKDPGFAVETQVSWTNSTMNSTWVLHSVTPGQDSKVVSTLTLQTFAALTTFAVNKPYEMFLLDSSTHKLYIGDVRSGWKSVDTLSGLPHNFHYPDHMSVSTNSRVLGASDKEFIVHGYQIVPNGKGGYIVKDPKVYGFSRV